MMTQTHLLVAAALFARPGSTRRNTAIIAGSLVPDLAIYLLFAFAILTGIPQSTLWNETYWSEPWQTYTAIGNSIPLYLAGLAASLVLVRPVDGRAVWQALPALFCLAALTHLAGDFPLHNDDAHEHFWPLSDWRFASPVSYWDRDHHGGIFSIFEGVLGLGLMVLLIRRFKARWVRAILFASIALYLLVPAFFLLSL